VLTGSKLGKIELAAARADIVDNPWIITGSRGNVEKALKNEEKW
jgi:hypothetical protein